MNPVFDVEVVIVQIDPGRLLEEAVSFVHITKFGADDPVNAGGQGGIMRRQRLVVVIVPLLLPRRKPRALRIHRHDQVGLLQYLMAVDPQAMIMHHQRVVLFGRRREVPYRLVQEGIVLADQPVLPMNVNAGRRFAPPGNLLLANPHGGDKRRPALRTLLPQSSRNLRRILELILDHQVRVGIVIDDGRIFVRPGHAGKTETAAFDPRPRAGEITRRFEQDIRPLLIQKGLVSRRFHVLLQRVADVRVDMDLGRAGGRIRRSFLPADRPPGVKRPGLAHFPCPFPGLRENVMPEF
ncbi:hypothetical protein D3C74_322860 [compost metagenome]